MTHDFVLYPEPQYFKHQLDGDDDVKLIFQNIQLTKTFLPAFP